MHRLDPPPRDSDFQPSSPRKPHPRPNSLPPNPTSTSTPENAGKSPANTKPTRHSQERTRITHNAELAEWANDPKNKNPQEFKKALIFTVFLSSLTLAISWSVVNNVVFPYLKKLIEPHISYIIYILIPTVIPYTTPIIISLLLPTILLFIPKIFTKSQQFLGKLTNKYFISSLALFAFLGAVSALLIPAYTNWFKEPGTSVTQQNKTNDNKEKIQESSTPTTSSNDSKSSEQKTSDSKNSTSDLRLHLLYITGGVIAVLGLIETNRKNSQDHIRQVHAARRERYIEAIDKLASENAPVRLGGVYALFALIDEWISDESLKAEIREQEGQVIINNLCAYIRSPYSPLLTNTPLIPPHNTTEHQINHQNNIIKINDEKKIRQSLLQEIKTRISIQKFKNLDDPKSIYWQKFNFDFSGADFFYSIDFSCTQFRSLVNFTSSIFREKAIFDKARFNNGALFNKVIFEGHTADQSASFIDVIFDSKADFTSAIFKVPLTCDKSTFVGVTSFAEAQFIRGTTANNQIPIGESTSIYDEETGKTYFTPPYFEPVPPLPAIASFCGATFKNSLSFKEAYFEDFPIFSRNTDTGILVAQFSCKVNPKQYNFDLRHTSYAIHRDTIKYAGEDFTVPEDCVLFDPSHPAKLIF